jgi:hypothetical protein
MNCKALQMSKRCSDCSKDRSLVVQSDPEMMCLSFSGQCWARSSWYDMDVSGFECSSMYLSDLRLDDMDECLS